MSDEDANRLVAVACEKLKSEPFDGVFPWAKEQLQTYPNCDFLTLYMARVLLAQLQTQREKDVSAYAPFLVSCCERVLQSKNERMKTSAAGALYDYYMGSGKYAQAEKYLGFFSEENPERKRKLAAVYRETGRRDEALQMYEELLYAGYQELQLVFQGMDYLFLKEHDLEKANEMAEKMKMLARLFEMGEYHEYSPGLELAILKQDADSFFSIMQRLLGNITSISGFTESPLYSHMKLKRPSKEFYDELRQSLLDCLGEEQCLFVQGDPRLEALLKE